MNSEGTKPEVKTRSWVKIIQSKCCVLLVAGVHSSEATISWLAQLCKCAAANSTMHCSALLCCSILQHSIALFYISMQCTVVLLITMQGVGTQCTVQSWRSRAEHIGWGVLLQQQQEFSSTVVGWSAQLLSVYIVYRIHCKYLAAGGV